MDARAAWKAKYAREPAPWRAGEVPGLAEVDLPAGARVLDVGAGGGKSTAAARARGWRVVPCDFVRAPLPAGGVLADAARLPFRDGAFDLALLVHVLGHLAPAQRERAAREAQRVARAQLIVVFGRGDVRATAGRATDEEWTREREGIRTRYFGPAELRALFPRGEVARREARSRWGARDVLVVKQA